ncbi:Protein of unknown function [Paenibacillaceae bacterium GAS479]|nr:Protein of unknown function [Paenibacillaceae bacterium GAS479]
MVIEELIHENNRLRVNLNNENKQYYEEMILYIRTSDIGQHKAEELLLEILQHLLQAQTEGRSASQVFGSQPAEYCRELVKQLPKPRISERLSTIALILWASLTWAFLLPALQGSLGLLLGRSIEEASQLYLSSILSQILLSVSVIWLIFRLLNRSSFTSRNGQFNWMIIVSYVGCVMLSVLIALYLKNDLPMFIIHPLISLLIFIVGLVGLRLLFFRKFRKLFSIR